MGSKSHVRFMLATRLKLKFIGLWNDLIKFCRYFSFMFQQLCNGLFGVFVEHLILSQRDHKYKQLL